MGPAGLLPWPWPAARLAVEVPGGGWPRGKRLVPEGSTHEKCSESLGLEEKVAVGSCSVLVLSGSVWGILRGGLGVRRRVRVPSQIPSSGRPLAGEGCRGDGQLHICVCCTL